MAKSRKQAKRKREPHVHTRAATLARLRLASIVESSDDAIIGKDMQGIITDWNNGATQLYGYSAGEVVGKPLSILMPPDRADDFAEILTKIRRGEVVKHFETVRQKKDGTHVEVSLTISPISDPEGKIIGASTISRNITERKRAERALRESEELLRMAAQAGRMVAYEWDTATDRVVRMGGVTQILGEVEGPYTTGQHILSMIPPEDRERLNAAIAQLTPEKPDLQIRYRMVRSDGNVIWVERTSRADFDEHRKMVRTIGMLADITDRVRTEEALREKDKDLSEAQRLAGVGSWLWDVRNGIVTWSEELYRIVGLDPKLPAPSYKEHSNLLAAESWERLSRAVEEVLQDGTSYELDLVVVRPDGTTRWVRTRGEAMADVTGRIVRLRGTAQDITERKLADENLADLSRKLLEAQEVERKRIARELHDNTNQRLALLAVEIEQLKNAIPDQIADVCIRVDKIHKQTLEISKDVQDLSHELHSSKLEYLGLVLAMKGFCRDFGDKHRVEVTFASEGLPAILPAEISLCLFRVMQEGLHNALKHSGVKFFEVKLHGSPTDIQLTVRDSGAGFDPELIKDTPGLGLISMQERVRLVKGTISITSRSEAGTEINVRVPLSAGAQTDQAKLAGA
jgi:PAS domain S-box-containing protein